MVVEFQRKGDLISREGQCPHSLQNQARNWFACKRHTPLGCHNPCSFRIHIRPHHQSRWHRRWKPGFAPPSSRCNSPKGFLLLRRLRKDSLNTVVECLVIAGAEVRDGRFIGGIVARTVYDGLGGWLCGGCWIIRFAGIVIGGFHIARVRGRCVPERPTPTGDGNAAIGAGTAHDEG